MLFALYGCSQVATPTPAASLPDGPLTAAQAEQLAGFDVMEPTYLPAGVTFDSATFQGAPSPAVTLHFKLVHETYGDMGQFFLITQQPKDAAPANPAACRAAGDDCETVPGGG
jgi:hypothetical protein